MLDAHVLTDPLIVTRPQCHAGLLIYNGRYSHLNGPRFCIVLNRENHFARVQRIITSRITAVLVHTIDSSHDQGIRELFTPLALLAERTNCAFLVVPISKKVLQTIYFTVGLALSALLPLLAPV